jgi:phage terminase large subunit GpA-like protein
MRLPLRGNVLDAPTQSGKTVFLQVAIADMIDQDPGPAMYILPDENTSEKLLQEKIIDVINSSPFLTAHKTSRVWDINKSEIYLDNMSIRPAWAGSLATISSLPEKRVFLDDVLRYETRARVHGK